MSGMAGVATVVDSGAVGDGFCWCVVIDIGTLGKIRGRVVLRPNSLSVDVHSPVGVLSTFPVRLAFPVGCDTTVQRVFLDVTADILTRGLEDRDIS